MDLNEIVLWLVSRGLSLLIGGAVDPAALSRRGQRGPSLRALGPPRTGGPPARGIDPGRRGGQAHRHDRGPAHPAPATDRRGAAGRPRPGRLRPVVHPGRHRPHHRGPPVRHAGRRPRLRHGLPHPRRGALLQGRLGQGGRSRRGRGGGRGDRAAAHGAARWDGLGARRLERPHPPVVERHPGVLGRDRGDGGPAGA